LSTTNPTWLDPGLNPGLRGGKPAINRLSYGAAFITEPFNLDFPILCFIIAGYLTTASVRRHCSVEWWMMYLKELQGNCSEINRNYNLGIFLRVLHKTTKYINRHSRYLVRDLNLTSPEYLSRELLLC
jgi:hypothetical protein